MKTADFDYNLPRELIAQQPLPDRSQARMMVVHRDKREFEHRRVNDLSEYLEAGDLLVVNDTRVIPARVFGHREDTGGKVELLFVEQIEYPISNIQHPTSNGGIQEMPHKGEQSATRGKAPKEAGIRHTNRKSKIVNRKSYVWECLYRASRPPRAGTPLSLAGSKLKGEIVGVGEEGHVLLKLSSNRPLFDILEEEGFAPVPPYIKRVHQPSPINHQPFFRLDRERYQTVYARYPGAVAAPTAGLHFTPELLKKLERHGVSIAAVTLHVGLGTFKPVKTEMVENHIMEDERYVVSNEAASAINSVHDAGGRIVAVGTTVVRVLETVASEHGSIAPCKGLPAPATAGEQAGRTSLFIYPPYEFKIVDAMLTNFHLPRSTLIMMVSAFACPPSGSRRAGKDLIFRAYEEAIRQKYRFYSYGDCMLIL